MVYHHRVIREVLNRRMRNNTELIKFTRSLISCHWNYEDAIKEFEEITGEKFDEI